MDFTFQMSKTTGVKKYLPSTIQKSEIQISKSETIQNSKQSQNPRRACLKLFFLIL